MTKNRRRKQDARRQKAAESVSYTQALRETQLQPAGPILGIPTSLPSLTGYTGGWKPGQLITVGAGTGVGKSIFALNSVLAALRSDRSVLLFSLELGEEEVHQRMVASMGGISLGSLGIRNPAEAPTRTEVELSNLRFAVDSDPGQTVETIGAKARVQTESEFGLDLIVIDSLQLIAATGEHSSRQEAVARISQGLKLLAGELQIPILVTAQLSRSFYGDRFGGPRISDIRESGAIAMDSDVIVLLNRREDLGAVAQPTQVILAKNRGGSQGQIIECHAEFDWATLREIEANPLTLAEARTRINPNPILQRWAAAIEAGSLTIRTLADREFSEGWITDGKGADAPQQADASNELSRLKRLVDDWLDGTEDTMALKPMAMIESWSRGQVATGELEPQEGLVWSMGEDGEAWFIQGTTDDELAVGSLNRWLHSYDTETLKNYEELEIDLRDNLTIRRDWFWAPLVGGAQDGDLELCHYGKDSARWTGQPLVRGVHAEV